MKRLIQIILACILIAIATGYFFKSRNDNLTGDRIIGIAVLAVAFILMPLFLVYRYKKTSMKKYLFPDKKQENDEKSGKNQ